MLGGGARGVLPPSPASSGRVRHGLLALVAVASFAAGAWTFYGVFTLSYGGASTIATFLAIVCVMLLGAVLFWVRLALAFMQSREYWRARAWEATRPEARPTWWGAQAPGEHRW
jgi:cation transporter-like permease